MDPIAAAVPFSRSQINGNVRGDARSSHGCPTTGSKKPREASKDEHLTENYKAKKQKRQALETDGQKSGKLVLKEIVGDLFTCPSDTALVCGVARDMQMKTPLLQQFKKTLSCDSRELIQNKRTGQIVTIKKHNRLVYFLIVKPRSCHNLTINSLKMCLENLREDIQKNNIKKIAMPRVGCGRNELKWDEVRNLIQDVFQHVYVHITVYMCNEKLDRNDSSTTHKFSYDRLHSSEMRNSEHETKWNRNVVPYFNANCGYINEKPQMVSEESNSNNKFKGSGDIRTYLNRDLIPASKESPHASNEMDVSYDDHNSQLTKCEDNSTNKFASKKPDTSEEEDSEDVGKRNANFNRGYVSGKLQMVVKKSESNKKFNKNKRKRDRDAGTYSERNALPIYSVNFNLGYVDEKPQMVSEESNSNIEFKRSRDVRSNFKRQLTPASNKSPHASNEMDISYGDHNRQLTKSEDISTDESAFEKRHTSNKKLKKNKHKRCRDLQTYFKRNSISDESLNVSNKMDVSYGDHNRQITKSEDISTNESAFEKRHTSKKKLKTNKHKRCRDLQTYFKRNSISDESLNVSNELVGKPVEGFLFEEIDGDLFNAPQHVALAHCVAEDFRMGAGIAIEFKKRFGCVDELLNQGKRTGEVAVIKKFGRFIYYLVTKKKSNRKPTMETLTRSLLAMKRHVQINNVKKIAMPTIGCGLDRLNWDDVKSLIIQVFKDLPVHITIYKYQSISGQNPKPYISVFIKNHSLNDMDHKNTLFAYFIGEDPHNYTRELKAFNQWREIVTQLEDETLTPGQVVFTKVQDQTFVGLVCIDIDAQFNFRHLSNCLWALKNMNFGDFSYMGIETQTSDDVKIRIIFNIFQYHKIPNMQVWICCPNAVMCY